jgi:hypothetical protein
VLSLCASSSMAEPSPILLFSYGAVSLRVQRQAVLTMLHSSFYTHDLQASGQLDETNTSSAESANKRKGWLKLQVYK